jgi:hypothetical protein
VTTVRVVSCSLAVLTAGALIGHAVSAHVPQGHWLLAAVNTVLLFAVVALVAAAFAITRKPTK